jgi:hypothetical protein
VTQYLTRSLQCGFSSFSAWPNFVTPWARTARLAYFAARAQIQAAASMMARLPIVQTAAASTGGSSFSPFATMSSISSGNGRCSVSASTVSPSNHRSNSSVERVSFVPPLFAAVRYHSTMTDKSPSPDLSSLRIADSADLKEAWHLR